MIIEWLYTMDINQLNRLSSSILDDLDRVYIASQKYMIADLCDSIVKYLESLISPRTFGEIYKISKRIGCDLLERAVYRAWISKPVEYNENNVQIIIIVSAIESDWNFKEGRDHDELRVGEGNDERKETDAILEISRQIVQANGRMGDMTDKLCLIKYLASSLSL
jgi:hypothetical protein